MNELSNSDSASFELRNKNPRSEGKVLPFSRPHEIETENVAIGGESGYARQEKVAKKIYWREMQTGVLTFPSQRTNYVGRVSSILQVFSEIVKKWHLGKDEGCKLLGLDPSNESDFYNRLLDGSLSPKGRDINDRIICVVEAASILHSWLKDEQTIVKWLHKPQPDLSDFSTIDFMLEGSFEKLIEGREFIEYVASGRS